MTDKVSMDEVFGVDTKNAEVRKAVADIRRLLPIIASASDEVAAARFVMFGSLVKAGFNERQALLLCVNITPLGNT